jgi:hypothetical protein
LIGVFTAGLNQLRNKNVWSKQNRQDHRDLQMSPLTTVTIEFIFVKMASDSHYFFKEVTLQMLYRHDILTSEIIWKVEFPDMQNMENRPMYVDDNADFIHNEGNHLLGLDLKTGQTYWIIENCMSYHSRHKETGHPHGITTITKEAYEGIVPIAKQGIVDVDLTDMFKCNDDMALIGHNL